LEEIIMVFHVDPKKAAQLNLRVAPKPGAIIVSLPQGTTVDKLSEHPASPAWWQVAAELNGQPVTGFVNSNFLKAGSGDTIPLDSSIKLPEAHLARKGSRRNQNFGRAFPLDEPDMPTRGGASAGEKAEQLVSIIRYLDPGRPAHKRYLAGGGKTYCNIYAYDYCQRGGVYLPRVWWTSAAIEQFRQGNRPAVLYGNTVREMTANMLHDWFLDYGKGFGWRRAFSTDDLQSAANKGEVAMIVAKRQNLARSGHILAVVPEHGNLSAARNDGVVVRPVQSQAGSVNFTAKVPGTRWWLASKFQSFGFWVRR